MVGVLYLVAGALVGLVTIVGSAFVLIWTDDAPESGRRLSAWSIVIALTLFVTVMLWSVWS